RAHFLARRLALAGGLDCGRALFHVLAQRREGQADLLGLGGAGRSTRRRAAEAAGGGMAEAAGSGMAEAALGGPHSDAARGRGFTGHRRRREGGILRRRPLSRGFARGRGGGEKRWMAGLL